ASTGTTVARPEKTGLTGAIAGPGGECDRGVWISVTGARREGATGRSAESMTVAMTASIGGGSRTGSFTGGAGALAGSGSAGSVGSSRFAAGDSGGITESIFGESGAAPAQMPLRFHVQFQAWPPVSIVCVVPPPVVSPHVHVQFQFQLEGREDAVGADW